MGRIVIFQGTTRDQPAESVKNDYGAGFGKEASKPRLGTTVQRGSYGSQQNEKRRCIWTVSVRYAFKVSFPQLQPGKLSLLHPTSICP